MPGRAGMSTLVLGEGAPAREALRHLPGGRLVPGAWHAEWRDGSGRLWIEDAAGVRALVFDRLLVLSDAPLILAALGCAFAGAAPVVDERGETTRRGVFAAGPVLGAAGAEAEAQARIAALVLAGEPGDGRIVPPARALPSAERLDPVGLAALLEEPPGPSRSDAALAQCALVGPVAFASPVGFAALAATAGDMPVPRPVQHDADQHDGRKPA